MSGAASGPGRIEGDEEQDERFEDYIYGTLADFDSRIDELEELVDEVQTLRARVAELESQTNMLRLVDDVDEMGPKQRSITLLQHLQRSAQSTNQKAGVDRDGAEDALHYPDVHRTTIYDDMKRAVRLVGDENVCWFESTDEGSMLKLNLENGDVPANLHTESAGVK